MEGSLYKWYGPFSRWHNRYCIVNNGQLEFYSSKNALQEGQRSLETHHISFCEITVDKTSLVDWSIQVPCHPIIYLKTDTKEERRRWLRILGSAKACLTNTSALNLINPQYSNTINNGSPESISTSVQEAGDPITSQPDNNAIEICSQISSEEPSENLREQNRTGTDDDNIRDIMENEVILDENATKKLTSICDDIRCELDSFQKLYCSEVVGSIKSIHKDASKLCFQFSLFKHFMQSMTGKQLDQLRPEDECSQSEIESQVTIDSGYEVMAAQPTQICDEEKLNLETFFTTVKVSFRDVMNEANQCSSDLLSLVKTETYMEACLEYTKFFDIFAGTLLSPLKNDILGNVEKIRKEFVKDPERYVYIQLIIEDEILRKGHLHSDSATQAVLWMMRGLRTVSAFFNYSTTPEHHSFKIAASAFEEAYSKYLKPYHNFVVCRMFTMGLKLIPNLDYFKKQVVYCDVDTTSPEVENELFRQVQEYQKAMSEVVSSIEKIYLHHNLAL
ncbi:pleckstrin homology domain-containing family A member 8-like [Styela clava]